MTNPKRGLAKVAKIKSHRVARKKAPLMPTTPVASTSTQNQFEALSDMDEDDGEETIPEYSTKNIKIPPVVITQCGFNISTLNPIKVPNMTFKHISIGIRISFPDFDSYDHCTQFLKNEKIEFYTHRIKNTDFKVIISGLPVTDPAIIREELLSKYNLNAVNIKELKTSYFNEHSRLYLTTFNKNEINLQQLNRIKAINQIIIKWIRYSPKHKGPSQCRKCLMFGHGQENCYRSIMCMLCASREHVQENCSFNNATDQRLINYRCGNCQEQGLPANHKANDHSCPSRSNFESIRNNQMRRKNNATNKQASSRLNPNASSFVYLADNFPSLPNHRASRGYAPTNTRNGNQNSSISSNTSQNNNSRSYSSATKQNLLSADEFFNIFEDALQQFYACKTSADQFSLIVSFMRRAAQHNG